MSRILVVILIAFSITNTFSLYDANLINIPYFVLYIQLKKKKRIGHMFQEETLILYSVCKTANIVMLVLPMFIMHYVLLQLA